jgi:hypothetical protein
LSLFKEVVRLEVMPLLEIYAEKRVISTLIPQKVNPIKFIIVYLIVKNE